MTPEDELEIIELVLEARRTGRCSALHANLVGKFPKLGPAELEIFADFCREAESLISSNKHEDHQHPAASAAIIEIYQGIRRVPGIEKKIEMFDAARKNLSLVQVEELELRVAPVLFALCYLVGNFRKSIEYFELTERHHPFNFHSGLKAAESMARIGDHEQARVLLERCEQQIRALSLRFQDRHLQKVEFVRQMNGSEMGDERSW